MTERIAIDEKYTYEFDEGRVSILRHGTPWVVNPTGAKAWIAAACEIEQLRAKAGRTLPDPKGGCDCSFESEDRGGGYSELVPEYEPACPVHSTHVYDPRTGEWIHRNPAWNVSEAHVHELAIHNGLADDHLRRILADLGIEVTP